jgi:predicted dehydrogenase
MPGQYLHRVAATENMATIDIGIIVHGATGRIGGTQHLANALVPIREEGGLPTGTNRIVPRLLLAGRDAARVEAAANKHNAAWTADLDAALADPAYSIFFDAAATHQREATLEKAIAAGKHIYSEKPVALSVERGRALLDAVRSRGLKHGAVEDKLGLPGLQKLAHVVRSGALGRVVGFRLEFGWWVFDGTEVPCQRPSWNYTRAGGGGLILDMFPHFRYMIENLLGPMRRVVCALSTATPERVDEQGARYKVDVEDTASTIVEMENGATGTLLASWATRVRRDDLLTYQIDGTQGSAIAGLHRCHVQLNAQTPHTAHFSVATDLNIDYRVKWTEASEGVSPVNPYRMGWENFLRHVVTGSAMQADLSAGIRDVAFAQACYRSMKDSKWVEL